MKKSELIKKLQEIPGDPEVCLLDNLMNMYYDDGDGSSAGVYPDFDIHMITTEDLPADHPAVEDQMLPWLAISFKNEEYTDVFDDRKCRVCGCTEMDCRQCIKKTGKPCHWIEEDLCSACKEPEAGDSLLLPGRDF
jgi:hypothetical protein